MKWITVTSTILIVTAQAKAQRQYEQVNTTGYEYNVAYSTSGLGYIPYNGGVQINSNPNIGLSIQVGNNYGYTNYYDKQLARNTIRNAKYSIREARNASRYYNEYHHLITLAIRHYNFSRNLYYNGNYSASINHAGRANRLAQQAITDLQFYNTYNDYEDDGYRKINGNSNAKNKNNKALKQNQRPQEKPIITNDPLDNMLPQNEINNSFDSKLNDL